MKQIFLLCLSGLLFMQCVSRHKLMTKDTPSVIQPDTLRYVDENRKREIPVAIYQPVDKKQANYIPVIFNHGYGANQGGDYLLYSYLAEFLASKGYFVISIQHELPTDELLPTTGNIRETRMPNWKRGAENIYYVLGKVKATYPNLHYDQLAVIGHSNGGDMAALFTHQHPELVHKLITLDNRRMELPRTTKPQVFSLRSNDYPADEDVLPGEAEMKQYNMTIRFTNINHSHMDNDASEEERKYITGQILLYLKK